MANVSNKNKLGQRKAGHQLSIPENKKHCRTEAWEQARLATYLDSKGYTWFHVPNGEHRHKAVASRLKLHGVKSGVPDCVLVGVPMIAIELKREQGGYMSKSQRKWKDLLESNGWVFYCAKGSQAAIDWLEDRAKK